jgi:hypothetical protein
MGVCITEDTTTPSTSPTDLLLLPSSNNLLFRSDALYDSSPSSIVGLFSSAVLSFQSLELPPGLIALLFYPVINCNGRHAAA